MKRYLSKLILTILLITQFAHSEGNIDNLLDNILLASNDTTVTNSTQPRKINPLSNDIDPIDPQSYSAMKPHTWLDNSWQLSSPYMEQDILKQEILRLQNMPNISVSAGASLKKNMQSPRVKELSTALYQHGLLSQNQISDIFGDDIFNAVKNFQSKNGLAVDGIAGNGTIKALSSAGNLQKLAALQWVINSQRIMPHSQGKSVIVNLPSQQLRAYENGQLVLTSRVIIGKKLTQTPVMSDYIEAVTFNPTWNVPPSIVERTYAGKKTAIAAGPENPLGKLRIDMYNPELIYLHHTNHPELFSRNERTFSSGCVRVEKAYDLARWLLGEKWDANNGDNILKTNRELQVKLNQKVPVYLEYRPVTVSATGIPHYHADPYLRVPSYR